MLWGSLIALSLCCIGIAYQDFKARMISLWLILCFAVSAVCYFLQEHLPEELLENFLFCTAYLLFLFGVLHLYFFLRTGSFQKLMDRKLGWGDVLVALVPGCCLAPAEMILFFSAAFVAGAVFQLLFFKRGQSVALAGILAACHLIFVASEYCQA